MEQRLQDRVAIVTGGGDGVGRGITAALAAAGARVVIAQRDLARAQAMVEEVAQRWNTAALAVRTDVAHKDQVLALVAATVERFGTVDILVNNAWGGGGLGRAELKSDDTLEHGFNVGFYGPWWAMQAVFPLMRAQGRGNIVNIGSLNGVNAHIGTLEYNSAKEAMRAMTRTAAREWAHYGIVANTLCPFARSTPFERIMETHPELVASAGQANPTGRVGDPETDIGPVAVFLASDDSRYLTGNTLFVDGGAHINGVAWVPDLGPEPA